MTHADIPSGFKNEDIVVNVGRDGPQYRVQALVAGIVIFDRLFDEKHEAFDAIRDISLEAREYLDSLT